MPCSSDDFWEVVDQLPEVVPVEGPTYTALKVRGKGFGYHWPATETVGLKQLRDEHLALVTERPDVFETQFVAGQFGWVVVRLAGVGAEELGELVFEAWRLTAPARMVAAQGGSPPRPVRRSRTVRDKHSSEVHPGSVAES